MPKVLWIDRSENSQVRRTGKQQALGMHQVPSVPRNDPGARANDRLTAMDKLCKSAEALTNHRMSAEQYREMHGQPLHPPVQRMSAAQYLATIGGGKNKKSGDAQAPLAVASKDKRRNKYGNTKVGEFDSSKEARVNDLLKLQMNAANQAERVIKIEHHVRFEVIPKQEGERASHYEADFVVHYADGRMEVIDVKSEITRKEPRYILKRKLMLHVHGIKVREM